MKRRVTTWVLSAAVLTVAALVLFSTRHSTLHMPVVNGSAQPGPPVGGRSARLEGETPASRNSTYPHTHIHDATGVTLTNASSSALSTSLRDALSLSRYPDAILDRDPDFGTPHFVRRRSGFLSPPAPAATPEDIVTAFIRANARKFTLAPSDLQPPNARVHQNYTTKHNGARHVRWQQQKDGLDIYGATFAANLTRNNEIINVSSRALHIPEVRFHDVMNVAAADVGRKAIRTQAIWYPLDMMSVVKAWDMIVETQGETHRVIVRADTGEVVEDYNCTWSLEPVTFNVYTNESPTPFSPGTSEPTSFVPPEVSRSLVTLSAFDTNASPAGWIPDGNNTTAGNNADAFADWDNDDAPDSARPRPTGTPYRVFDTPIDLASAPDTYVDGATIQAFYCVNLFHDLVYALGFDEAAGNFQQDNFGRGGFDNDRVQVHIQDGWSVGDKNNANFTAFGDGGMGRMQLYVWTHASPDRDSALDAEVVFHEAAHGLSTRLIGDGFGLGTTQARGMGEGWSDFIPLSLTSQAADDPHGCYPFGAYVDHWNLYTIKDNYYYGIRRFPYCTDTNKAPQTFADTDPNQMSFPPSVPMNPKLQSNLQADQIHRIGEVWCLALWECRANLVEQYGFTGNDTMLQLVVDGMKLTPVNPTFTQARDAILQADLVNHSGTNQLALWRGFAKRGLGYSSIVPTSASTVGMQEAFDMPFTFDMQVSEAVGDGDGYVEPGETGEMVLVLTSHELALTNASAALTALSSNITLTASNAVPGDVAAGGSTTSAPPFAFTVDPAFPGFTDAAFTLRVESDKGWFEESVLVRIGNPDDYPPEILDVAVTSITETNAWVTWTTGIPADGLVEYGTTTNYGLSTSLDPVMRTDHLHALPGLTKGTDYHYRIVSEGTNGLDALSDDFTFRTRARIYVNVNSTATQELGTIAAPFKTLQAAAQAAKTTGDDILVAQGTYTGTNPEAVLNLDGSSWNLTVCAGYSDDFSTRDPDQYVTVIDGEKQRRGIRLDNGATLSISGVTITRGEHEWGGGVSVRKSMFSAEGCTLTGNASTSGINQIGGALHMSLGSSAALTQCVISDNIAESGGGAFIISTDTVLTMERCTVSGNTASSGGGVAVLQAATLEATQSLVLDNTAPELAVGGGIFEATGGGVSIGPYSTGRFHECTVAGNRVFGGADPLHFGGGGLSVAGSSIGDTSVDIINSIICENEAGVGEDLKIRDIGSSHAKVHADYSCIGEIYGSLTSSNHLIRTDPHFANPAAGDFHLLYGSPCIDTGDPTYFDTSTDMDDEPRPFGAAIDMGADEFTDTDTDHMADYWETNRFGNLTTSDGTADGDNDALDDFGEYMNQTDPHDSDTDNDLAQDGWEVANGYDPLDRDQDDDGMWDGWEAAHSLNAFTNDAALNPDGDPHDNLSEFTADTDPHDSNSVLQLLSIGQSWGGTRLDWKGGRDSLQYLETSPSLFQADWTPIYALPPPTPLTNAVIIFGVTNRTTFYRIRVER